MALYMQAGHHTQAERTMIIITRPDVTDEELDHIRERIEARIENLRPEEIDITGVNETQGMEFNFDVDGFRVDVTNVPQPSEVQ